MEDIDITGAYHKTKPMIHIFINLPTLTSKYFVQQRKEVSKRIKRMGAQNRYIDPRVKQIIEFVVTGSHVTFEDILSRSRLSEIVRLRFVCIYLIIENCKDLRLTEIARYLSRDHSTIIHARDTLRDEMSYSAGYKAYVLDFQSRLKEPLRTRRDNRDKKVRVWQL